MSSRLLKAIDKRIAKTRDAIENACLRAERAALLARQGLLDEARAELRRIHAQFDSRPNARVSAWTSLAEGLVIYFDNLAANARDKLLRSLALAAAIGDEHVEALSAAWLAQMDFAALDLESLVKHLPIALTKAAPSHHSARSRAALVAAEAYHWAERLDLALPWYTLVRHHASAEGDEPTLSALMHNMTWMRAAEARRRSVAEPTDAASARQTQMGADSIGTFDELIGMLALRPLVPILQAQALMLNRRHAEALDAFEQQLPASLQHGLGRMACVILADMALCRVKTGDPSGARADIARALESITTSTQVDDLAITHSRLAEVYELLEDLSEATKHSDLARSAWHASRSKQEFLVAALRRALEGLRDGLNNSS